MNHGVVQSSPVQQMVAAGSPTWWTINNIRPPPHHHHHQQQQQHHSLLAAPPSIIGSSSWNDSQEQLPDSWSQLLLGGLVGEDDKQSMNHIEAKKLENWEQQFLNQSSNGCGGVHVKQENYNYSSGNVEFQSAKPTNCWSHQMVSASSPKSCITSLSNNLLDFSPKSSQGKHPHQDPSSECNSTATGGAAKKARTQACSGQSTFKVRKEKLGDRVTALHQLVSPFGKTDTASVLLEAIGYIKFLQSQIEALSQPYLGSGSSGTMRQHQPPVQRERNCLFPEDPGQLLNENCIKRRGISDQLECDDEGANKDLKSRGLCLVPISCTLHVGSENGADYWAPAFGAANFT